MASEIVITSVPRGVKLGRTGFQVAMQTAGMRDDVSKQLEKMAGYRHLPGDVGGNPVSYFHRLTRTVAGPLHVVGRIVDAGVDFSNRSNKLAHMVVLEAAEAAGLAASSPAAALAAIEGRLASSWPGGPEERQFPFSMAGLPASQPAPCGTWQQLLGDAGWAGVIADRALRNQPTLIVSPDPSPASCRRLLALFEEALALVPPAKRWAVTFDTTTLAPDGILWRGTYAGSPESAATQPGLLVLELARPQPIPAEAAASDLVAAARTGRGPMPQVPAGSHNRATSAAGTMAAPRGPATAGGGPTAAGYVPPPPNVDTEWVEVPLTPPPPARPNRGFAAAVIIGGSLLALVVLVAVGTVAYFTMQSKAKEQSLKTIQDYAANEQGAKAPSAEDVRRVIGRPANGAPTPDDAALESFNQALSSQNVERADVGDEARIRALLEAIIALKTKNAADSQKDWPRLIGGAYSGEASQHLAANHETAFKDFNDFRKAYDASVVAVRSAREASQGATATGTGAPANALTAANSAAKGKPDPSAAQQSGQQENKSQVPLAATGTSGVAERGVLSEQAPQDPAFIDLQTSIATFKSKRQDVWPLETSAKSLFSLNAVHAKKLTADVIVGNSGDFKPQAARSDSPPDGALQQWTISVDKSPRVTLILDGLDGNSALKVSTASGSSNPSSDDPLRFLPIGFKLPNGPPIGDNWLRLSQSPVTLNLSTKDAGAGIPVQATLHDVLCKTGKADLPFPKLHGTDTRWKLTPRVLSPPDSPIALTITPVAGVEPTTEPAFLDLLFTGTVTSGTSRIRCSLQKRLTLTMQPPCTITNEAPPWPDQLVALFPLAPHPNNAAAEQERKWLGINDPEDSFVNKSKVVAIFLALLKHEEFFGGVATDQVDLLLAGWALKRWTNLQGRPVNKDPEVAKAYETVSSLRETLVTFLIDSDADFVKESYDRFTERNSREGKKQPPELYCDEPEPKPVAGKQNDPEFQKLHKEWETKQAAADTWKAWKSERDAYVRTSINDRKLLHAFWSKQQSNLKEFKKEWRASLKEPDKVDRRSAVPEKSVSRPIEFRELAAIKCLLELDSLLLVKFHREKLEELLRRVPVGALFQGQIEQIWELDGKPLPPVVAYELIPGDLLPPTATAPAQEQAAGGTK